MAVILYQSQFPPETSEVSISSATERKRTTFLHVNLYFR